MAPPGCVRHICLRLLTTWLGSWKCGCCVNTSYCTVHMHIWSHYYQPGSPLPLQASAVIAQRTIVKRSLRFLGEKKKMFHFVEFRSAQSYVSIHLQYLCPHACMVLPSASLSLFLCLLPFHSVLSREVSISHVSVILTMLLLVALSIVFSPIVVTAEKPENPHHKPLLNYSRISLPPEHVPYFLYNSKRVAKQCRLDPLCPFKVRYARCGWSNNMLVSFPAVLLE